MTRILPDVAEILGDQDFVRGIHSVGLPRPVKRLKFANEIFLINYFFRKSNQSLAL
jgi:GTP-dependent phosphoenolpyruvate carboxykinase